MSWLNLNDSLNSLKGQLSNFANNVLADEDERKETSGSGGDYEDLQRVCTQQQEEISYLRKINAELSTGGNGSKISENDGDSHWSWKVADGGDDPKSTEIIANLKKTLAAVQTEKQDLISSLEQLDSDHQLNTEKLVGIKDKIQNDYNQLEDKYNILKDKNKALIEEKKRAKKEIDDFKSKADTETNCDRGACPGCKQLLTENHELASELEKLAKQLSICNSDPKTAVDHEGNVEEKFKLCEAENKILVSELQKAAQVIAEHEKKSIVDAETCKKLALILEGYEQQVSTLKQELAEKNAASSEDINKLEHDFAELHKQLEKAVAEKQQTHMKYVNILTENVRKYVDCSELDTYQNSSGEDDPQVLEYRHQVESIITILMDFKLKCESMENDLYNVREEKTKILSEKNHEIEKLLHNSEILSQEVITKSQTIKDYESECNELIKNNDILINELEMLKNKSGLQTISESNEDNVLLLESQLENANKRIEEMETLVQNLSTRSVEDEDAAAEDSYGKVLQENSSLKAEIEKGEHSCVLIGEENDRLNLALEKMKIDLENTEYQYTELHINMETQKEELENQKKQIQLLQDQKSNLEKLNTECERNNEDIRTQLNVFREKLLFEEDTRKHLDSQVRNLTEKLQHAKMSETSFKLQYDTISKELVGVNEAKCLVDAKLESCLTSLTNYQDNLLKLQEENEELKKTVAELEASSNANSIDPEENSKLLNDFQNLKRTHEELLEDKNKLEAEASKMATVHENCATKIADLEKKLGELNEAKNELTNVVITKHQENITYHNEIQRLSQILNAEVEKSRGLEALLQSANNNGEIEKKNEEIEKLTDQNNFLRQKCEVLAENLLQEQGKVQQIIAEHSGPSEKELALNKKLERLQAHLIEVEEHYTQELLRSEEKNAEFKAKINEIELREKNSSTMYTSVSIRANQHVETLQHQLQLITNQRDELRRKISDAEDHGKKQEAALANLQFVLEQFQKDKEKDVQTETERIRRQLGAERKVQEELKNEIRSLQAQLEESKTGLQAASRLSDQLEQSKQFITALKSEVAQLKEKLQKNDEQLQSLSSQSDGKVDKSLIKNLVLGFVSSNTNLNKDQSQILKIIATVLDFNQQDHDKINLNKPQQGWLGSIIAPQTSQGMSQESLSQAFVKFLENESKPRTVPSLLANTETPKSRKSSVTGPRQSPSILSEVVLPTFADFAQNRNSSSILKDVLKDNS